MTCRYGRNFFEVINLYDGFKLTPISGGGSYTVVSARLSDELVKRLDETAGKTGLSRNKVIQLACEYALERLEIENGMKA